MFAAVRADNVDFPLLLHIAGATILVGALVVALVFAVSGSPSRLTFRALLWAAVPSFIVMRVAAEWVANKEGYTGDGLPDWLDIGRMVSDPAALAIFIATIIAGVSSRKGGMTSNWVTGFTGLAIVLALVAVWAMTAKPT
jgi:hypothetical protein